jgi:peptidoglycan/LPS O-acetylase OafA/YrhL
MRALAAPAPRLPWIDHLRTAVIILVVNMHACVTYSHVGDWYVMSAREPSLAGKLPFILWQGHLQSFFMGLLFFISGYFAERSLSRRGSGSFVRERLVRLGVPTLIYMLVIHPFILLGLNPWHARFGPPLAYYFKYLQSGRFVSSSGPLWFALALLIFCLVFALWRTVRGTYSTTDRAKIPGAEAVPSLAGHAPSARALWAFALMLGLGSFLVRLIQPIGKNLLNLQLCFFVQYIAFFAAGVRASRGDWLLALAHSDRARRAGWLALIGGPLLLLTVLFVGMKFADRIDVFFGGWHGQALGFALWEQLSGVGLSLGLLALFSARMNRETTFLRWLSDRSFGVYVLHAPVLVALFMVYLTLPLENVFLLSALLTVTGLVVSFVLADLVRRIPGLRRVI